MTADELAATATALVAPGKGILAADESSGTIEKRFKSIQVESTEEQRRAYRELLFTPRGRPSSSRGVILYDETLRQQAADGTPLPRSCPARASSPGSRPTPAPPGWPASRARRSPRAWTAWPAGWPSTGTWGPGSPSGGRSSPSASGIPTAGCIAANAEALARFAALSQEAGLVPIVEPEVLMDGDHTIERCDQATRDTLAAVFAALHRHRVRAGRHAAQAEHGPVRQRLSHPGRRRPRSPRPPWPACATTCRPRCPGSCSSPAARATRRPPPTSNAMNRLGGAPWQLSFSYGRALQAPALKAWKGEAANGRRPSGPSTTGPG